MTETVTAALETRAAAPESPYKGLLPYTEADADFFFGRANEREMIASNLLAARLTLLYGPSGVGKSSVLNAGAVRDLHKRARLNFEDDDTPGLAVAVVRSWRSDPVAAVAEAVRAGVAAQLGEHDLEEPPPEATLGEMLEHWSRLIDGKLLLIFDQFEEYFLYHDGEDGRDSFAVEFPRAVNRPDLRVNFLISIRDDALARLDRFKGRIPNLFANRLQIDHLDLDAARDAVLLPLEEYNRRVGPGEGVEIEPALVNAVLDQVRTGRVALGQEGAGTVAGPADVRIETPMLQLVLTRIWDEEQKAGSKVLRAATLERLGGAGKIVRGWLDEQLSALSDGEQATAARIFHFLVTKSGTKIAHTAGDLAEFAELPESDVLPVLEQLSTGKARILRPIAPPGGGGTVPL